jgi:hypothetical protein
LNKILSKIPDSLEFVSMHGNQLIVRTKNRISSVEAGVILLALEKQLDGIEVFIETRIDDNQVRKLRGVQYD